MGYGDPIIIYPKPKAMYVRGTIHVGFEVYVELSGIDLCTAVGTLLFLHCCPES